MPVNLQLYELVKKCGAYNNHNILVYDAQKYSSPMACALDDVSDEPLEDLLRLGEITHAHWIMSCIMVLHFLSTTNATANLKTRIDDRVARIVSLNNMDPHLLTIYNIFNTKETIWSLAFQNQSIKTLKALTSHLPYNAFTYWDIVMILKHTDAMQNVEMRSIFLGSVSGILEGYLYPILSILQNYNFPIEIGCIIIDGLGAQMYKNAIQMV
jgi:hypothetical protein